MIGKKRPREQKAADQDKTGLGVTSVTFYTLWHLLTQFRSYHEKIKRIDDNILQQFNRYGLVDYGGDTEEDGLKGDLMWRSYRMADCIGVIDPDAQLSSTMQRRGG